ncbi:MAG: hypothetical protein UV73_C0003G0173 [Candidatus Gottesmanbacteria bacterium GW2011_GWA2_43_14]|uniref:Uncharacterized protein n=1 Tax=Candidatus Gottesmanbacteria bacterium GW2011_GWA2_43_14 TaxID=1618443 RepID=A0A0G1FT83_9BACT|nr:MAG: hypothetical protein UV73_C0003G0173 [Candidatus Gottesmanbacteria bacterium GW2011_GWA2_43_14]
MSLFDAKNNLLIKTRQRFKPVLKNSKTASYFTITLSLFCLSFFGLFAIRPTLITAVSLIKEVNDLKNRNLDYENQISLIIRAQSEYEKVRDGISLIDLALPRNADFTSLSRGLEESALANGFNINQLQIDSAPISTLSEKQKLQKMNFILIGNGSYENIKNYLDDILNWQRIITLESLDIAHEGGTSSGILRITAKGSAYYEP